MEKKHVDEIDESYFGEEFIDDSDFLEEIKVEDVTPKKETKKKATAKKTSSKKSEEKNDSIVVTEMKTPEAPAEFMEKRSEPTPKEEPVKAVEEKKESEKRPVETSKPVNPWEEPADAETSLFKEISTWKALTGIVLILLIFAVFTNGFQFSEQESSSTAISIQEAEQKALEFVNDNLLQPPYTAEVLSSTEEGDLYLITLSIAGQTVDSYMTKDGELFFPQGFEVTGAAVTLDDTQPAEQQLGNPDDANKEITVDGNPMVGSLSAPITIVEFSDFQCPFCGQFFKETLPQLEKDYIETGRVKLVFKQFPLPSHPEAEAAALASLCANEQGKFWQYHDLLFSRQSDLRWANYPKWAGELGLDQAKFEDCMNTQKYLDKVNEDMEQGKQNGVTGTPAFFINGELLSGNQPYSTFKKGLDAMLGVEEPVEVIIPEPVQEEPPVPEPTPTQEPAVKVQELSVSSRKWSFTPDVLKVKSGTTVQLTVLPDNTEPSFALPSYTFAISGLSVSKAVDGRTMVEFTPSKAGTYEFSCSSCEDWRGMSGTLVVE
ncbi:hypothetical protein COV20_05790 [Candidatus Woesearchaeota archaeon CG10_big_fil_rev_8_21_14_0_10_45_16]|nr:MAG: hypothetical protein COV20_05790 [Candidatus Woesearchaeota archaeon CG10_big_fil_rev_8_21_14_0_10_45_16]